MIYSCETEPIFGYILGISVCIGIVVSYIPQYYSLIKSKQTKGISEYSLLLLNLSSLFLTANSFILNFQTFRCYFHCSWWLCTLNLLSFIQIAIAWLSVVPLYVVFLQYLIQESKEKPLIVLKYGIMYLIISLILILGVLITDTILIDKISFEKTIAQTLGIISAILSGGIWIPQIIELLKIQEQGSLSLVMFFIQTPGTVVQIFLQIIDHQDWTTWIAYAVTFVEQVIIIVILIIFKYKSNKPGELEPLINERYDNQAIQTNI